MQFSSLFAQATTFFAPIMQKLLTEPGHGIGYSGHQWHEVSPVVQPTRSMHRTLYSKATPATICVR